LLQSIWLHQRLLRDQLKTLDDRPVRVLHPGFRSVEGGPDFRGAVIAFAGDPPQTGDVEVDLRLSGWHAHGHDRNPAFRNVILHVVWDEEIPGGSPRALALRPALDSSIGELSLWLGNDSWDLPDSLRGKCCSPLRDLPPSDVIALLHEAAFVRLQTKASQFQARARQVGWEQSLWEGLFRALGYKQNIWPMQCLGELRPRWAQGNDSASIEARLFGISGLLPDQLTGLRAGADAYVRSVWDRWWRELEALGDCALPRTLWRLSGMRPPNQPQRRLALAARWSVAGSIGSKLERWCAATIPDTRLTNSLLETLQVENDDFWSWHYTLRSSRLKKPQPLLGATRVTDLAVNVVLPWLWSRAMEGKDDSVRVAIEHRYFSWPAAEDNSLLRLARQRLLGGPMRRTLADAAAQQGLIQIVRDFCEHSNAVCDQCRFPELVRERNRLAVSLDLSKGIIREGAGLLLG
jgi:hypothetical protein